MRNSAVDEILNRVTSRRISPTHQTTTATNQELNIEELVAATEQSLSEEENQEPVVEEVPEIPQNILAAMEQYFDTRNLEDSVEDVPLPEEEEKKYDSVIARDETARFSSAEWFRKAQSFEITLAGLGGIGSWVSLLLARLKPASLALFDSDRVEMVNLAGQLYGVSDCGKPKVTAVCDYLKNNANYYGFIERCQNYTSNCSTNKIMICGFDSMSSRRTFYQSWKNRVSHSNAEERKETLFIDGRLTATEFQVFCMTGEDTALMSRYQEEFLFDDSQASQEVCSFKQTAYLANMIAGVIVNLYVNFCANLGDSPFKKALPFLTKYNTDMMSFSIEY